MPQNAVVTIKGIVKEDGQTEVPYGLGGTICEVGLNLPSDFDVNLLRKGSVLCDMQYPIKVVKSFVCRVVLYDIPFGAVTKGE